MVRVMLKSIVLQLQEWENESPGKLRYKDSLKKFLQYSKDVSHCHEF